MPKHQPNIVWLASYPKSGNTWFRAYLSALLGEAEDIDLNGLKFNSIFSSRGIFSAYTDIDSTYLYDDEVKLMQPEVFNAVSNDLQKTQYIKIHDAYTYNALGNPIVPTNATKCAIYIIRNPLDIVASFANHMNSTLDFAIEVMNDSKACLAKQKNNENVNSQTRQLLLSWSDHVQSWIDKSPFKLLVIRYEDMLNDPITTFTKATRFLEIDTSQSNIVKAINSTSFDKMQHKENETGFREKNQDATPFFRLGKSGNWINELSKEQVAAVIKHHSPIMNRFNYSSDLINH
jgi:hypothetical protein